MKSIEDCRTLAQQCLQHYINNSSCKTVDEVIDAIGEYLIITLMTLHNATNENQELITKVLNYCDREMRKPGQGVAMVQGKKPATH